MLTPDIIYRQYKNIKLLLSKRQFGHSTFPPESFNFSFTVDDSYVGVMKNRNYAARTLGIPLQNWIIPGQNHSANILEVNLNHIGSGAFCRQTAIPNTDAVWTRTPRIALAVSTADCLTLAIADPKHNAVAAIHSGWRGCAASIAQKLVSTWQETLKSQPQELLVWFGSYLSADVYEIGIETAKMLCYKPQSSLQPWFLQHPNPLKLYFDQAVFVQHQLVNCGIQPNNIHLLDGKGYVNASAHFSHRLEHGATGRSVLAVTFT